MSDVMLFGMLQMPPDLAMCDDLSRMQFYSRAQEAVKRIQDQEVELTELRAIVARLREPVSDEAVEQFKNVFADYSTLSPGYDGCIGAALNAHNKRILGETE